MFSKRNRSPDPSSETDGHRTTITFSRVRKRGSVNFANYLVFGGGRWGFVMDVFGYGNGCLSDSGKPGLWHSRAACRLEGHVGSTPQGRSLDTSDLDDENGIWLHKTTQLGKNFQYKSAIVDKEHCKLYKSLQTTKSRLPKTPSLMSPPFAQDTGLLTLLVPGIFLDSSGQVMACPDPEVGLYVKDRSFGWEPNGKSWKLVDFGV